MSELSNKVYRIYRWLWGRLFYARAFAAFGRRVVIEPPTLIAGSRWISIDDGTKIRRGVRLEAIAAHGRQPRLTIGANTNIEQNVHIVAHNYVAIGRDVSITANCAIVDVTHPIDLPFGIKIGETIADDDARVEIGDGCFLGIGSVILPNVHLGRGCVVGANSVVTRSFPDGAVIAGAPARLLKIVNRSGAESRDDATEGRDAEA